jgi:hypothetical protein
MTNFSPQAALPVPTCDSSSWGNSLEHKQLSRRMFDTHYRKVHVPEVENQSAMRIVEESTQDD